MRVKGVNRVKGRQPGQFYYYHRTTRTRLTAPFGSPLFFEELAEINKKAFVKEKPRPGTLGDIIESYRASPSWTSLAWTSKEGYERALLAVKGLREKPAVELSRGFLFRFRDEVVFPQNGRWLANYTLVVLARVFKHAQDRELLGGAFKNPLAERVERIRAPRRETPANRPWTPEECRAVLDAAPINLKIPLALAMFAGLRKGDFLRVTMADIAAGRVDIRTRKTGKRVKVPIHPELAAIIAQRPKSDAVQVALTFFGTPWTITGFNASWGKFRRKLEADGKIGKGLTIHGLRHTIATRLREAGAHDRDIADVLGHASTSMARHYSKNAALPANTEEKVLNLQQALSTAPPAAPL